MNQIKVICRCGAVYKLPSKFAGKKVKCKMCPMRLEVPGTPVQPKRVSTTTGDGQQKSAQQLKREKEEAVLKRYEGSIKRKEEYENFIEDNFKHAFEKSIGVCRSRCDLRYRLHHLGDRPGDLRVWC